ncbi:MAG TPA: YbaB/EbfC family nucleoid-associated protein [Candidatus Latescibacteria bacterium]|nr:YbaB/EbfC family nucleoid-associated protein [Candidatus Latescibacterota bacterium]
MQKNKEMTDVLKQAQILQTRLAKLQDILEERTVEGSAGGGMVTVVANGKQDILELKIDPEVVTPEDVEMLEDLILAAIKQARKRAQDLAEEEMRKMAGGLIPYMLSEIKIPGLT